MPLQPLPRTAFVWNGPAVGLRMRILDVSFAEVGRALGVDGSTVRNWTKRRDEFGACSPSKIEGKIDLAALLGSRLADFLLEVDRETGEPVSVSSVPAL